MLGFSPLASAPVGDNGGVVYVLVPSNLVFGSPVLGNPSFSQRHILVATDLLTTPPINGKTRLFNFTPGVYDVEYLTSVPTEPRLLIIPFIETGLKKPSVATEKRTNLLQKPPLQNTTILVNTENRKVLVT